MLSHNVCADILIHRLRRSPATNAERCVDALAKRGQLPAIAAKRHIDVLGVAEDSLLGEGLL